MNGRRSVERYARDTVYMGDRSGIDKNSKRASEMCRMFLSSRDRDTLLPMLMLMPLPLRLMLALTSLASLVPLPEAME